MRKAVGVGTLILPGAAPRELETFTCNHCSGIRPVEVVRRGVEVSNIYWCDVCDARVCGPCVNEKRDHRCVVWERKMEAAEHRQRFLCDVVGS